MRFVHTERSAFPIAVTAGVAPPVARLETSYSVLHPAAISSRNAAFRAAMNAGVVAAILSSIADGSSVFAFPLAGFLCVLLYRKRITAGAPTPGIGFRLGAIAGLVGFAILILLKTVLILGFHAQNILHDELIQFLRDAQSRYTDPQMRQSADRLMTPEGLAFFMIFVSAFMCVLLVLLSGVGGAISAVLLRRKSPPQ